MSDKHLPPKDMPASTLWSKLQEMPRPHRFVDFPRKGPEGEPIGKIAIYVLTQEEQMICAAAAEKFAKEKVKEGKKEDLGYETVYANESVIEILFRACRDTDDLSRSAFPTPEAMRRQLTTDEVSVLFEQYLSVQLELGPIVTKLSKEEYEAWIDRIAEGGLANSPLALASPELVKILAHSMASQLVASRTGKSFVGSPPGDTQPNEPEPADTDESI